MTQRSPRKTLTSSSTAGLAVFVAGVALAWLHLGNPIIAIGGYVLAFVTCYFARSAWLVLVPTAIVAGHSYPVTGSLLVSPGDLWLIAAVSSVLFRCQSLKLDRWILAVLTALLAVVGFGAVRGWLNLPESRLNDQLDLYLTGLNALYVLKGYALGTLLGVAFLAQWQSSPILAWKRLTQGVHLSALVVAVLVLIERSIAFGVFNFSESFRASGPCFSMHIGGQHIDAFWVLTLPFLLFANRPVSIRSPAIRAILIATQVLSIYAIFVTMSRALIALTVMSILVAIVVRVVDRNQTRFTKLVGVLGGFALLVMLTVMWFAGDAVQDRFSASHTDLESRISHSRYLRELVAASDPIVGTGLGTYPLNHREHQGLSSFILKVQPTRRPDDHGGILIQPNCRVYLEQLVDITQPSPWEVRLRYSVTSRMPTDKSFVRVIVCEKTLLQSFECAEGSGDVENSEVQPEDEGGPAQIKFKLDVSELQNHQNRNGSWLMRRPTSLAVVASGDRPVLLREIEVVDASNDSVINNGDFRHGSRHWMFTADDHLVWRTKNAWLHMRIELGWSGLIAWAALLALVAWRLQQSWWPTKNHAQEGTCMERTGIERERTRVGVAILVCWLPMSLFGTLVDTPWILQLMILLLVAVSGKQTMHTRIASD